ncbi:2S sulfur-rich seed storage protein 2-like [Cucurbita maxima]|uniref:2S sulfur-rich seed storage protein 2-like n=1 Tax=Cucurbita maxima TaxID=3661 RepID=A0A6J1JBK8_CUCMA|nr:2S sulfur-rich seed storage protein 2-like [Cucurbita maxima]
MARHPFSLLLLLSLFLLAASALRFHDDNQNPWLQRCRQQVRGERLRHCEQLLMRPRRVRQLLMAEEEEDAVEHLEECCQQLRGMDDACRCEGLRQIVQRRRQQGRMQGIDVGQMLERATNLPSVCRLSQRRCELRSSRW